jgi:hypothetical protein
MVEFFVKDCLELTNKFPQAGSNIYMVLEDALEKQTISQAAYIEITSKGDYLFTETSITEEAKSSCWLQ